MSQGPCAPACTRLHDAAQKVLHDKGSVFGQRSDHLRAPLLKNVPVPVLNLGYEPRRSPETQVGEHGVGGGQVHGCQPHGAQGDGQVFLQFLLNAEPLGILDHCLDPQLLNQLDGNDVP